MATPLFELSYAGIPFLLNTAKIIRLERTTPLSEPETQVPPRKHQAEADLIDELNRLIPFQYLQDVASPPHFLNKAMANVSRKTPYNPSPPCEVRIGDWYYPVGASRWGMFRGLATSSQVKEILAATGGSSPKPFVMQAVPTNAAAGQEHLYRLQTNMYCLPPLPLAEHGGKYDGLYLVTLVDERYNWQYAYSSHGVLPGLPENATWTGLVNKLAGVLGVSIFGTAPDAVYAAPEQDSPWWVHQQNSAVLLDAVAANIGRVVIRRLDGTYFLISPAECQNQIRANLSPVEAAGRAAGGNVFGSGADAPLAGDLRPAMNAVLPASVNVTFPMYVMHDQPVPHFINNRYIHRGSCQNEDSYGDVYIVNVPISSGGPFVSGLTGVQGSGVTVADPRLSLPPYVHVVHTAAKSLCSGVDNLLLPLNLSGITSQAVRIAEDYYGFQACGALNVVFPGTYDWEQDGIHDVVWTYSARDRQATTRVFRSPWSQSVKELQMGAHALPGHSFYPKGVGGPSVAQSVVDEVPWSGFIPQVHAINLILLSGGLTASISPLDNLPTQNRWKGAVNDEIILFEGTSGGAFGSLVQIAYRGIDGSVQTAHPLGSPVSYLGPDRTYGVNLVTYEKGQFVYPGATTSGGIQEVKVVPQTQTVEALSSTPETIRETAHYLGAVNLYNPSQAGAARYPRRETVWLVERNNQALQAGQRYDGQLAGYSVTHNNVTAPVYLVNVGGGGGEQFFPAGITGEGGRTLRVPISSSITTHLEASPEVFLLPPAALGFAAYPPVVPSSPLTATGSISVVVVGAAGRVHVISVERSLIYQLPGVAPFDFVVPTGIYAWEELEAEPSGLWRVKSGGRKGTLRGINGETVTRNPGFEANRLVGLGRGTVVYMTEEFNYSTDPPAKDYRFAYEAGGGVGGSEPHNLLSATHPDTVPYSPSTPVSPGEVRPAGSLIQANDQTPSRWQRHLGWTGAYTRTFCERGTPAGQPNMGDWRKLPISSLDDAETSNLTSNLNYYQEWRWALTGSADVGMEFGEYLPSPSFQGTLDAVILKASTKGLVSSTHPFAVDVRTDSPLTGGRAFTVSYIGETLLGDPEVRTGQKGNLTMEHARAINADNKDGDDSLTIAETPNALDEIWYGNQAFIIYYPDGNCEWKYTVPHSIGGIKQPGVLLNVTGSFPLGVASRIAVQVDTQMHPGTGEAGQGIKSLPSFRIATAPTSDVTYASIRADGPNIGGPGGSSTRIRTIAVHANNATTFGGNGEVWNFYANSGARSGFENSVIVLQCPYQAKKDGVEHTGITTFPDYASLVQVVYGIVVGKRDGFTGVITVVTNVTCGPSGLTVTRVELRFHNGVLLEVV